MIMYLISCGKYYSVCSFRFYYVSRTVLQIRISNSGKRRIYFPHLHIWRFPAGNFRFWSRFRKSCSDRKGRSLGKPHMTEAAKSKAAVDSHIMPAKGLIYAQDPSQLPPQLGHLPRHFRSDSTSSYSSRRGKNIWRQLPTRCAVTVCFVSVN